MLAKNRAPRHERRSAADYNDNYPKVGWPIRRFTRLPGSIEQQCKLEPYR